MHHPNWRGGRVVDADGYVLVRLESQTYMLEHRLVMEKSLYRNLRPDEIVHHINGIRDDNRIENLQIMTHAEHSRHHRLTENRPTRYAVCHPDRKHEALDLCEDCYGLQKAMRWNKENPEKVKAINKVWRDKNPEKRKATNEKWQAENPEKAKECRKKTYDKYAEDRRQRSRDWREKYPEKYQAMKDKQNADRRERKKKDPEAVKKERDEYYEKNRERILSLKRERDSKSDKNKIACKKYQAKKKADLQ